MRTSAESSKIPQPPLQEPRDNPHRPTHETTGSILSPAATENEHIFNPDKLRHYHVNQVSWWDESHQKCCLKTIQGDNGYDYITTVRRDENDNPTLEGEESKASPVNVNLKYKKGTRFAFGIALVMRNDRVGVGKRMPLFEYTKKLFCCVSIGTGTGRKYTTSKDWSTEWFAKHTLKYLIVTEGSRKLPLILGGEHSYLMNALQHHGTGRE